MGAYGIDHHRVWIRHLGQLPTRIHSFAIQDQASTDEGHLLAVLNR